MGTRSVSARVWYSSSPIERSRKVTRSASDKDPRARAKPSSRLSISLIGSTHAYEIAGPDFAGKGYLLEMQGEVRSMRESFQQFTSGLIIAAILVYLVMVAQFKSFVDPFVIMLTVPLGFIGVVALLWATGTNLSIMTFMGIIMMVGIVVEYSIVLVHFANERLREGATPTEAILEAGNVRVRPILMTSLTTALALLPMAIGLGGGDANVPLARTIIGGVVGATVLTLLVVPCLYVIFKRAPKQLLPPQLAVS